MYSMAMWMLLAAAPLQAVIGDFHGLNTLEHQPAKIAAMEGHWQNKPGESVPLLVFGWPDMQAERTQFAIGIPKLGSLILTHSMDGQYPGLKEFAPQDRPNSLVLFWTFRAMVGLGVLMIALAVCAGFARLRGNLYVSRPLQRFALFMGPAGLLAILAGWMTTEIGRQPWIVYGLLRTSDAVSPHGAGPVALTLAIFVVVYFAVFGTGSWYLLKIVAKGPESGEARDPVPGGPGQPRTPSRPLSAAPERTQAGGALVEGRPR
jgi:cytochrome d ubiquinol oxidase subunit I